MKRKIVITGFCGFCKITSDEIIKTFKEAALKIWLNPEDELEFCVTQGICPDHAVSQYGEEFASKGKINSPIMYEKKGESHPTIVYRLNEAGTIDLLTDDDVIYNYFKNENKNS